MIYAGPMHDHNDRPGHSSWGANHLNNALRVVGIAILILIAAILYHYLLRNIIKGRYFLAFLIIWIIMAYVILPRVYRAVSRLFLPNYFFGRTQVGDGLLGDPINLAVIGKRDDLVAAMEAAGWSMAEPLNFTSGLKMIYAAVRGANYPNAPVSALFVFNNKQNFAFEKDLDGNPRKRHHARFWKTPEKWWLPGGSQADWLGAATFDKNVGLSLFTGQVTHKIDADVDQERDFVLQTLREAKVTSDINLVRHFTSSYHSRNGGGDMIHTDGALPFITLKDDIK